MGRLFKTMPLILAISFGVRTGCLKAATFDHQVYDGLLKKHVEDGRVDYAALGQDPRLDRYLEKLAATDPATLEDGHERMAFWINAYNAYTLKLITQHYPLESILDIPHPGYESPWKVPMAKVGGNIYTLDHMENGILRVHWSDPRIHYALVCAARSCPRLRSEAYSGQRLNDQLEDQARWFVEQRNQLDAKTKTARLSKVYEWYAEDFGKNTRQMLQTLIPYVNPPTAASLRKDTPAWKVSFLEWDWSLNRQP